MTNPPGRGHAILAHLFIAVASLVFVLGATTNPVAAHPGSPGHHRGGGHESAEGRAGGGPSDPKHDREHGDDRKASRQHGRDGHANGTPHEKRGRGDRGPGAHRAKPTAHRSAGAAEGHDDGRDRDERHRDHRAERSYERAVEVPVPAQRVAPAPATTTTTTTTPPAPRIDVRALSAGAAGRISGIDAQLVPAVPAAATAPAPAPATTAPTAVPATASVPAPTVAPGTGPARRPLFGVVSLNPWTPFAPVTRDPTFPALLLGSVLLYLLVVGRGDRRDPKLAEAVVDTRARDVDFT